MVLNDKGKNNIVGIDSSAVEEDCTINFNGNGNEILIGSGSRVSGLFITVWGDNHKIKIGQRVTIYGGAITFEDSGNLFQVGDDTLIFHHFCAGIVEPHVKIIIGKNCLFSNTVRMRSSDSHAIIDKEGNRINPGKDIIIGDHVWICENVHILKGTCVQSDSVVGTCSVLTKEYPPKSVIAGNPAKVIKSGINWRTER